MPGGNALRTHFRKLFAERLVYMDDIIDASDWPESPQTWNSLFTVRNSNRMREEFLYLAGLQRFVKMDENDPVTYDKMVQGPTKSVTHQQYGLGFTIGWLMAQQDLDGIMQMHARELAYSMRMSIQAQAADFWNGLGNSFTTADGQYVVDSAHTYVRGSGTFSNLETSTLGQSALENAVVKFRKEKDLMGNPQPIPVRRILTPPDLTPTVHELLESRLRHDTTTNADNWLNGRLDHVEWEWVTDTTQWVLLGPQDMLKVFWFWNVRPETTHGYDFDRDAGKTKTFYVSSVVCPDPRGIRGYVSTS